MCKYYTPECSAPDCSELVSEKVRRKGKKCSSADEKVSAELGGRKEKVCVDYTYLGRIKALGMYCEGHGDNMDEAIEQSEFPMPEDVVVPKVEDVGRSLHRGLH
jgi:hypothetical protein